MERRKFVIGLGALAAGGAAAAGTGAFSSAAAERSFDVDVVSDGDAYVGLEATSPYADDSDDQIAINFSDIDDDESGGGKGLNEDAAFEFRDVFKITNQGDKDVRLAAYLEDDVDDLVLATYGMNADDDGEGVAPYLDIPDPEDEFGKNVGLGGPPRASPGQDVGMYPGIKPGNSVDVAIDITTDEDEDDISGQLIIIAVEDEGLDGTFREESNEEE